MKIYWSRKDIPEFAGLPASVSHKNYKEARTLANRHVEAWLGGVLYVVLMLGLFIAFDRLLPGKGSFAHSMVTVVCGLLPAAFFWNQITVYVIRKYYKHILARRSTASGEVEKEAQRLIQEADEREFQRWQMRRRFGWMALVVVMLVVIYRLLTSA